MPKIRSAIVTSEGYVDYVKRIGEDCKVVCVLFAVTVINANMEV